MYVLFGRDLAGAIELSTETGDRLVIQGAAEGDGLGTGAIISDITGDGEKRLVLVAAGDQGPGKGVGKIYVIGLP